MPVKTGISIKNPSKIAGNSSYLLNINMVKQYQEGNR